MPRANRHLRRIARVFWRPRRPSPCRLFAPSSCRRRFPSPHHTRKTGLVGFRPGNMRNATSSNTHHRAAPASSRFISEKWLGRFPASFSALLQPRADRFTRFGVAKHTRCCDEPRVPSDDDCRLLCGIGRNRVRRGQHVRGLPGGLDINPSPVSLDSAQGFATRLSASEAVRAALEHYKRTGSDQPEDLRRILGDPIAGVEYGPGVVHRRFGLCSPALQRQ